ncbi:hypothetical protein D1007_52219 [Hordeum vulgare]|nr:hypothetical protein D1007_52219 [Hordeum vulgare]
MPRVSGVMACYKSNMVTFAQSAMVNLKTLEKALEAEEAQREAIFRDTVDVGRYAKNCYHKVRTDLTARTAEMEAGKVAIPTAKVEELRRMLAEVREKRDDVAWERDRLQTGLSIEQAATAQLKAEVEWLDSMLQATEAAKEAAQQGATTSDGAAAIRDEEIHAALLIKVTELRYGLIWPLQVYGSVALRNSMGRKASYLFRCTRDSCQTLTQKDPFLRLTGPSCAIWLLGRVSVDVQLKVKCKKESEDEVLAYKFYEFFQDFPFQRVLQVPIRCKRCTLEFNVTVLPSSVEATVGVRVVDGSWPDQCRGLVVCNTDSVKGGKVVLLDSQDGKLPTKSDGVVELVRRVVSVDEPKGKLIISVEASCDGFSAQGTVDFQMQASGRSTDMCDLVFCKMEVTVCWSPLLLQNILE